MELRDIEYFVAIAQHGNVGRAAESFGLSQPALSKSLRRLEGSMQTKLVKKIPKGIELTAVGSAFLAHVRRIRLSLDDVAREVADLTQGRSGHLRVGAGPGSGEHMLAAACSALLKDTPKVTLTVTVATPDVLVPVLRNGELDLIVTGIPISHYEDLVQERLCDDEFVVYASVNHRLAKRKQLTLANLAQERWVMTATSAVAPQWLHRAFQDSGLPPPRVAMQTTSITIRHHLVASCEVVGLGTREVVRQGAPRFRFAELRVKGLTYSRSLDVSYRKDAYLPPAARRLIEILKTTGKEITGEKP